VEDEDFVRNVTCEVLRSSGYIVSTAEDATEAKELLRRSAFLLELLLTDIVLPDQNGCELAQVIRKINPGLLTIFMSGYPQNAISRLPQQQQMFYLPKPFSASSLLEAVRRAFECLHVEMQAFNFTTPNGDS
jgi:two-component system cell cycle sensor histidine kinase/response regulator CckA